MVQLGQSEPSWVESPVSVLYDSNDEPAKQNDQMLLRTVNIYQSMFGNLVQIQ